MDYSDSFSDKEKIAAFDKIAGLYFDRNFGSVSKADFETLMFSIYIEHLLDNELPYDDYTMSNSLGISESRIRTLKERKQLKYPREYIWQEAFAEIVKYAKYDDVTKTVKLSIEDVNLLKEVRHFIRINGWYDDFQLNPRLFQCKLDCFLMLCAMLDGEMLLTEDDKKKLLKLKTNEDDRSAIEKIAEGDFKKGFYELVFGCAEDVLCGVLESLPFGKVGSYAVKEIMKWLKKRKG